MMDDKKLTLLVQTWQRSIPRFAVDALSFEGTKQQHEFFTAVHNNRYISCKSGHGTGKSTAVSVIILWALCCLPDAQVLCTAPTSDQLRNIIWSRVSDLMSKMIPEFFEMFIVTNDRIQHRYKKSCFAVARTARPENPDALQGFHAKNLIIIADEASGIADALYNPVIGAMTEDSNKLILIGNPVRRTGFFAETFEEKSGWENLTINAEESEIVSRSQIEYWRNKYGYDSDEYKVRVLGEFPAKDSTALFAIEMIETAYKSTLPIDSPVVWGVDIAGFGDDDSVLAIRYGNVISEIQILPKSDVSGVANWLINKFNFTSDAQKPFVIFVDVIGIGAGVYSRLIEMNMPAREVISNAVANYDKRYSNKRAEMYVTLRDKLEARLLKLPESKRLTKELLSIEYLYDAKNRYQILSKQKMKSKGVKSPDVVDSIAFTFCENISVFNSESHLHRYNRPGQYNTSYRL